METKDSNNNPSLDQKDDSIIFDYWEWDNESKNWIAKYKKKFNPIPAFKQFESNNNCFADNLKRIHNTKSVQAGFTSAIKYLKYDNGTDDEGGNQSDPDEFNNDEEQEEEKDVDFIAKPYKNQKKPTNGSIFFGKPNQIQQFPLETSLNWNISIQLKKENMNMEKHLVVDETKFDDFLIFNAYNKDEFCKVTYLFTSYKILKEQLSNMKKDKYFITKKSLIEDFIPEFTLVNKLEKKGINVATLAVTCEFMRELVDGLETGELKLKDPFIFLDSLETILPNSWIFKTILKQMDQNLRLRNPTYVLQPNFTTILINALSDSFKNCFMERFEKIAYWIELYFDDSMKYTPEWENLNSKLIFHLQRNHPLMFSNSVDRLD